MGIDTETGRPRRRRVQLSRTHWIPVPFSGERGGEGPLTFGQTHTYVSPDEDDDYYFALLRIELEVPPAVTPEEVAEALAVLVSRHESLRTTYVHGEPPRQRVEAAGVQMMEVCSLGDGQWGPRDRPAVADALMRWMRESPDPENPPMSVSVAVAPDAGGHVVACSAAFSHTAMDHAAILILQRELTRLLGDPARRQLGPPGHQPLDQAELEATPAEQLRADAALERLEVQLRRVPHCLYSVAGALPTGESLAVELFSEAAATAVRQAAARARTSRSAVVFAAICAVVGHRAGYPRLVSAMMSGNRFERHLLHYVGSVAQGTMAAIETGGRSFDELAAHTWTSVMEASRIARYNKIRRNALYERIEQERGLRFSVDPLFNSLVVESWAGLTAGVGRRPDALDAALARSELQWRPIPNFGKSIRFGLHQIDGRLQLEGWSPDSGRVPRAELESLLLAVERLLVAAAHDDVAADRIPGVIGLEPVDGGPDRLLVDFCRVDLADVRRLVREALAPAVTHVVASADGQPLVAYLTAADDVRTPQQAHARCMAVLTEHPAALTPRHYVVCATAPADPTDATAWPAPLAAGSGRDDPR